VIAGVLSKVSASLCHMISPPHLSHLSHSPLSISLTHTYLPHSSLISLKGQRRVPPLTPGGRFSRVHPLRGLHPRCDNRRSFGKIYDLSSTPLYLPLTPLSITPLSLLSPPLTPLYLTHTSLSISHTSYSHLSPPHLSPHLSTTSDYLSTTSSATT
jgi:hypothetical protein